MKKFSELEYKRIDFEKAIADTKKLEEAYRNAKSAKELHDLYMEDERESQKIQTMAVIAHIRNTINMNDEFYDAEMKYNHENFPKLAVVGKAANQALMESPYFGALKEEFGDIFVKNKENSQKLTSEKNIENQIEESRLTQEYAKLIATCEVDFQGEKCNFYGLLKHMESTDREERKAAFNAWADLYKSISDKLDEIYTGLVKVRSEMAANLGLDSYITQAYLGKRRFDYNKDDVVRFRKQVKDVIVPACAKLREQQRQRLGVDKLYYYDEALIFPEGNAEPIGDRDYMVGKAKEMYRELSKETGEFFDFMVDYELFDLETKPGKRQGGYCTYMTEYKAPFIFSNFNGTSADVEVLTHEAGHAFAGYTASRVQPISEFTHTTSEVAEIHSMTMEHFTYPWMDKFFGDKTDKFIYAHLAQALLVVPYMVCVDEYQHRVFEKLDMTPAERRQVWRELEKTYMPWRDYDGNEFLEEGGFWMQKQHIFLYPFYYIDYALAQTCAFQLYGRMKHDKVQAWEDYYALCKAGGSKGYFDLLKMAHLLNPFDEGTVAASVEEVLKELNVD